MRAAIVGTGYVGLVSGACLAELGHEILCLDHDAGKIARLIKGEIPIYEPGLEQICARNVAAGRLRFGTDLAQAAEAELILLAVGTPPHPDTGEADLRPLYAAAEAAARHLAPGAVLVVKSTVPVGTNRALAAHLRALRPEARIEVASNPEFLREGAAVTDFLHPDRVVAGAESAAAHGLLAALYAPLTARGVPLLATGLETAASASNAASPTGLGSAPAPAAGITPAGGAGWAGAVPASDTTAPTGRGSWAAPAASRSHLARAAASLRPMARSTSAWLR